MIINARQIGILFAAMTAFMLITFFASPSHARSRHHHHFHRHHVAHHHHARHHVRHHRHRHHRQFARTSIVDTNGGVTVIGSRPAGCPHAYCGCGLRKYLGIADTRLNLAWNWARLFPRTSPQAGAAAVRHHHVMLLVSHVSGTRWIVRDYNGGRHLSYIHTRDVRGYVFVSPRARMAAN